MKRMLKKIVGGALIASMVAAMAVVTSAAPATPEEITNLIQASNFYEGNTAWNISPNSVVKDEESNETVTCQETYVEEEVPTIGKTRVLQITQKANDTMTSPAVVRQYVRLKKGKTYKLSYWLKVEGEGSSLVVYYNPVGVGAKKTTLESGITETNEGWKKFEYTFNVEFEPDAQNEEFIRFEMSDAIGDNDVVFKLTDVQLEQTVTDYVPDKPDLENGRWSSYGPGHDISIANNEIKVVTSGDAGVNPNISFTHDMEVGVAYTVFFHLEIEGDVDNTQKTNDSNFNIYQLYGTPNNMIKIDSTNDQKDYEQEWIVTSYTADKTPTVRMFFARPSSAEEKITYTLTNLTIIKSEDVQESTESKEELVTAQPDAITTNSGSATNLCIDGNFQLADDVAIDTKNFQLSTGLLNGGWSWRAGEEKVKQWAEWTVEEDVEHGNIFKVTSILDETNSSAYNSWFGQEINWTADKTYRISFWVKTGETKVTGFYPHIGGTPYDKLVVNPKAEWAQYVIEYTPEETKQSWFQFMVNMKANQVLYLADIKVEEQQQPNVGELSVAHKGWAKGTYTISFEIDIEGTGQMYEHWTDGQNTFFTDGNRGVLYQTGFTGDAILTTFDATTDGTTFTYEYMPSADNASTGEFILYLAPTTGGELTYTVSDFSITYHEGAAIKEIIVANADITSGEPGQVSTFWGENGNADAYTLIQRWERVNHGTFATTDETINTELTENGTFTDFVSGATYRYSLVVVPKDGYYLAEDVTLKWDGIADKNAKFYYSDSRGSMIIYPAGNEIFFTVMGDANKDGSANVKDLVRMKKYVADKTNTVEVYEKKCNFNKETLGITTEDIDGFRTYLAEN